MILYISNVHMIHIFYKTFSRFLSLCLSFTLTLILTLFLHLIHTPAILYGT